MSTWNVVARRWPDSSRPVPDPQSFHRGQRSSLYQRYWHQWRNRHLAVIRAGRSCTKRGWSRLGVLRLRIWIGRVGVGPFFLCDYPTSVRMIECGSDSAPVASGDGAATSRVALPRDWRIRRLFNRRVQLVDKVSEHPDSPAREPGALRPQGRVTCVIGHRSRTEAAAQQLPYSRASSRSTGERGEHPLRCIMGLQCHSHPIRDLERIFVPRQTPRLSCRCHTK